MSKTKGGVIFDPQNGAKTGALKEDLQIAEKEARPRPQVVARKKLADISNLAQNQRLLTKEKSQSTDSHRAMSEFIDQLQKENIALVKMVAQKNKIIEQRGVELDILRVSLPKMQQQNHQLALSNAQMLAELNSAKERLQVLLHDLGCKNGLLKARQLELEETRRPCENVDAELIQEEEKSSKQDRDVSSSELVQSEKNGNKRPSVRRKSARFQAAELKPAEELNSGQDQLKFSQHELWCKNDVLKEKELELEETGRKISCKNAEAELIKFQEEGESSKQDRDYERPDNTKRSNSVSSSEQDHFKEKTQNERSFVRRQSARFKATEVKYAEDLCETVSEKGSISEYKSEEFGKTSALCRPSRVAARKVQSYKEIPVNVKMRRPE